VAHRCGPQFRQYLADHGYDTSQMGLVPAAHETFAPEEDEKV
jgi:hypothetical protein